MKGTSGHNLPESLDEVGRLRDIRSFRAISIWLVPDVYLELKRRSDAEDRSMNDIIADALAASDSAKAGARELVALAEALP